MPNMLSKLLKAALPLAAVAPSLVAADGIIAPKDLDIKSACKFPCRLPRPDKPVVVSGEIISLTTR